MKLGFDEKIQKPERGEQVKQTQTRSKHLGSRGRPPRWRTRLKNDQMANCADNQTTKPSAGTLEGLSLETVGNLKLQNSSILSPTTSTTADFKSP